MITPIVRSPFGSTYLANLSPSEVARSSYAFDTAKINEFGFLTYGNIISKTLASISGGYSPTGILVNPGRSIIIKSSTLFE